MALKRAKRGDEADQRQTEVIPVGRALRPGLDLFVRLQVMPCLSTCFVQKPPPLDVSGLLFPNRGYRCTVQLVLMVIGIAIQGCLVRSCHLESSEGRNGDVHDLEIP